uniref:uncharacterized protein LOC118555147 isoform X1 n=1 Tax=Halichoerus grypus TaxID=9711 RepID=UPI0016596787|nr:uncharacterized protein LOC118555147 isoform X1 [Halichoerus grypus]
MIVIKKDPLARRTRIRLSVLPGLRQGRHRPPGVVLTFTFLSPTDVTALRNSSICRGENSTRWSLRRIWERARGQLCRSPTWSEWLRDGIAPPVPSPPLAAPDSVSLAETLYPEWGAKKRGKVPLGEGVYAGRPITLFPAQPQTHEHACGYTHICTHTDRPRQHFPPDQLSSHVRLSRVHPWVDREAQPGLLSPPPSPLKWPFDGVKATDTA